MKINKASVVITGAGGGLGAALATELVSRGARVMLSDIDEKKLKNVSRELSMPRVVCDATKQRQVQKLAKDAREQLGHIDIWINNAGIWVPYSSVEEVDQQKAKELIDVNYFGLAYGTIEAVKQMKSRRRGVILNIISVRGLRGKALASAYSASKFAAEGFTQSVREELKDSNIKVIGVYPFRMKTHLFDRHKHHDYESSMDPSAVAKIIVDNIASKDPKTKLEIWDTKK